MSPDILPVEIIYFGTCWTWHIRHSLVLATDGFNAGGVSPNTSSGLDSVKMIMSGLVFSLIYTAHVIN